MFQNLNMCLNILEQIYSDILALECQQKKPFLTN